MQTTSLMDLQERSSCPLVTCVINFEGCDYKERTLTSQSPGEEEKKDGNVTEVAPRRDL